MGGINLSKDSLKGFACAKLIFQRIPSLCLELEFLAIAGDEELAKAFLGDVTNLFHTLHCLDFLVVADRNREEKFVIFAAIHRTGGEIHVEFLCLYGCLVVDRNVLLIYTATAMALLADVHQFAAEADGNAIATAAT